MALDRQKATQFRNSCAAFDITNRDAIASLSNVLDQLTTELAKSEILRSVRSLDSLHVAYSSAQATHGQGRAAHLARASLSLENCG